MNTKIKQPSKCWLWNGSLAKSGYGGTSRNGKSWRVHRLMWTLINGDIPNGLYIIHKCDVRHCINPHHLRLGTARDNLYDCISKGRFRVASGVEHGTKTRPDRIARGRRHGSKTHPECWTRGSSIPWSKLTEDSVIRLRQEYDVTKNSFSTLARKYGVSYNAIRCAIKGITWKHVTPSCS